MGGKESVAHFEHRNAQNECRYIRPQGRALRLLLLGWEEYAYAHQKEFGSLIGDDGVLGEHWTDIARGIHGLLDGNTGGWDAGSIDHNLREILKANNAQGLDG